MRVRNIHQACAWLGVTGIRRMNKKVIGSWVYTGRYGGSPVKLIFGALGNPSNKFLRLWYGDFEDQSISVLVNFFDQESRIFAKVSYTYDER